MIPKLILIYAIGKPKTQNSGGKSLDNRMVNIFKLIIQHIKEYCEQAGIHGPQHIVSERFTKLERLVLYRISNLTRTEKNTYFLALNGLNIHIKSL